MQKTYVLDTEPGRRLIGVNSRDQSRDDAKKNEQRRIEELSRYSVGSGPTQAGPRLDNRSTLVHAFPGALRVRRYPSLVTRTRLFFLQRSPGHFAPYSRGLLPAAQTHIGCFFHVGIFLDGHFSIERIFLVPGQMLFGAVEFASLITLHASPSSCSVKDPL